MRKMEVARRQMTCGHGEEVTVVYSVTVDERASDGPLCELEDYGICVDITESGESACLRGITVSAASIGGLVSLVSDNLVTPCTLHDVVYDWLCS